MLTAAPVGKVVEVQSPEEGIHILAFRTSLILSIKTLFKYGVLFKVFKQKISLYKVVVDDIIIFCVFHSIKPVSVDSKCRKNGLMGTLGRGMKEWYVRFR